MKDQEKETEQKERYLFRKQFEEESKTPVINGDGEYDFEYVEWLENKLIALSPPPEEQKVKDGFEEVLRKKFQEQTEINMKDTAVGSMEETICNAKMWAYSDALNAYLKHTPKQKEDLTEKEKQDMMQVLVWVYDDLCYDGEVSKDTGLKVKKIYDEVLVGKCLPKAPEKEGRINN